MMQEKKVLLGNDLIFDFLGASILENKKNLIKVLPRKMHDIDVLDLCSGEGTHLPEFIKKGARITSLDYYEDNLSTLERKYNLVVVKDDVTKFKIDNKFNIIHLGDNCLQLFDTFEKQFSILRCIKNHLLEDGYALINVLELTSSCTSKYIKEPILIKTVRKGSLIVKLFGQIIIDSFNNLLIYRYTSNNYRNSILINKTITTKLIFEEELQDMLEHLKMEITKKESYRLKNLNNSVYYTIKLKMNSNI